MNPNNNLVELVEENGNRISREDAIEALSGRYGGEERAAAAIDAIVEDSDRLVSDRFGSKDRIEKVTY